MLRRTLSKEDGQSVVLIGLMMVGLISGLGLVIDGGRAYAARRQSQNASDAICFAAARVLLVGGTEAQVLDVVDNYARSNQVASANDVTAYFLDKDGNQIGSPIGQNGGVPAGITGIRDTVVMRIQPYFISLIIGGAPVPVSTVTTCQTGPLTLTNNLLPMTVHNQDFQYGQDYQLQGAVQGPGSFQWTTYDCNPNNQDLEAYLTQVKSSGWVRKGDWVCANTGVMPSNSTKQALDAWLAQSALDRQWVIPVYDTLSASGSNLSYHIMGFALFQFDGYDLNASPKSVTGQFIKWVDYGPLDQPAICNVTGTDVCGVSLY